jgi:hypothetical protein
MLTIIIFIQCLAKVIAWAHLSCISRPWAMIIVFILEIIIVPLIFSKPKNQVLKYDGENGD